MNKKLLFPMFTLLIATLMLALLPTEAEGAIYEDTVRLHILANSDTEEDQILKLRLRDAILDEFGKRLSEFKNKDEAEEELRALLPNIKTFSEDKLIEWGKPYCVSATLCTEDYETRDYGDYSLPSGNYTSLKIIIGEGKGRNWWCVMFPPLCLDAASEELDGYTDEEVKLIGNKYAVKFKILELISELAK